MQDSGSVRLRPIGYARLLMKFLCLLLRSSRFYSRFDWVGRLEAILHFRILTIPQDKAPPRQEFFESSQPSEF